MLSRLASFVGSSRSPAPAVVISSAVELLVWRQPQQLCLHRSIGTFLMSRGGSAASASGSVMDLASEGHGSGSTSNCGSPSPRLLLASASAALGAPPTSYHHYQQIRTKRNRGWAFTKQRLKRAARAEKRAELRETLGVADPRPKPPKYIPRDLPVVNAQSNEEKQAIIRAHDIKVTEELRAKLKAAQETKLLRANMTGMTMSDRVRKLFDLHNGSQMEVIKAQKQLGMEVFQMRPGDTGSSSVQGRFDHSGHCIIFSLMSSGC